MNNINGTKDCYGCGVCAIVCAQKIITISLNSSGFYSPKITDLSVCTNCGLCLSVCAYQSDQVEKSNDDIKSYSGWSKDSLVRRKCSSGGIGFELGLHLLKEGYKVCGVRYNVEKNQAEHYIAKTKEELVQSAGSKYIQSYTVDGFSAINRKEKYLVTGTPCQIDSFRKYIKKFRVEDNFVLMDFFCHGVPSKLMWDKYIKEVEKKTGKITYVSWRNKFTGWHDSWSMAIDGENVGEKVNWHDSYNMLIRKKKTYYNSRLSQGDLFYKMFLGNSCLGKACYDKCKYKMYSSAADIRIGDMWGNYYKDNEDGVSAILAFTDKGKSILSNMDNCKLVQMDKEIVTEGQMKSAAKRNLLYEPILNLLRREEVSLQFIKLSILQPLYLIYLPIKVINRIKRILWKK